MANRARDFLARFISDTKRFDTDDVVRGLDDVADTSTDAARTVDKAFDKISRSAADAGHDVEAVGKEAFGEAGKEVGAEFAQNVGQGLASGNVQTLAQDTAGGLVSAFANLGGPVGLALAPVAAAAAGIFAGIQANAQKTREAVASMFEDILAEADKTQRFRTAIESEFGDFTTGLEQIQQLADETGLSVQLIGDAFAGNAPAAAQLQAALDRIESTGTRTAKATGAHLAAEITTRSKAAQSAEDLEGHLKAIAGYQKQAAADAATQQVATANTVEPAKKVAAAYKEAARQSARILSPSAALKAAAAAPGRGPAPGGIRD